MKKIVGPHIKVEAYFNRVLWPKPPVVLGVDGNNYGITSWVVTEVTEADTQAFTSFDFRGEEKITVKGTFMNTPIFGTGYTLDLTEVEEEKYGRSYYLNFATPAVKLESKGAQKRFLSTFLSPLQMNSLYEAIENPFEAIENGDLETLKKAKGIGDYFARKILERYEINKKNMIIYSELAEYNISDKLLEKIMKAYTSPEQVIDVIKNHPYDLVYKIDGIGFKKADDIALKVGFSQFSVERVKAFIVYFLKDCLEDGDSYITASELVTNTYSFFGGKEEIYEEVELNGERTSNFALAMKELQESKIITVEEAENKARRRVFLTSTYELESKITDIIFNLASTGGRFNYDGWEERVAKLEEAQGFKFDEEQINGIKLVLENQVSLISGLAGSGKSSLVSGVLAALGLLSNLNLNRTNFINNFVQVALSGKAAARLKEVTGEDGKTIHRALEYNGFSFDRNENNYLYEDVIILDEISLVGGEIFLSLIKAIKPGSKLIMLGDLGQLESIGALNLAYDFSTSPFIPTVELKKVHRQAAMSGIITTSHKVRNQEQIFEPHYEGEMVLGELKDMVLDIEDDRFETVDRTMEWFKKMYVSPLVNKDIMKLQVIVPVKERGEACVYELNNRIQEELNPVNENSEENLLVAGSAEKSYTIHTNDKVMCIKNNYTTKTEEDITEPIFNGWCGLVEEIENDGTVRVYFNDIGKTILVPKADAREDLILGYASTVHKNQGSGYPVVIGAIDGSTPPMMLTNSLLYTLITRAKKYCIVVAQNTTFYKATDTNFVSTKRTFTKELLEKKFTGANVEEN